MFDNIFLSLSAFQMEFDEKELRKEISYAIKNIHGIRHVRLPAHPPPFPLFFLCFTSLPLFVSVTSNLQLPSLLIQDSSNTNWGLCCTLRLYNILQHRVVWEQTQLVTAGYPCFLCGCTFMLIKGLFISVPYFWDVLVPSSWWCACLLSILFHPKNSSKLWFRVLFVKIKLRYMAKLVGLYIYIFIFIKHKWAVQRNHI